MHLNNAFFKQSYWRKATQTRLGWSRRYKNSRVVITNWLTVTKYPFLKCQWIFVFFSFLSQTILLPDLTIWVTRPVSNKNQPQLLTINQQTGSHPGFWSVLRPLLVFSVMFFVLFVFCLFLVPNTARVPGLSILECHFSILHLFIQYWNWLTCLCID